MKILSADKIGKSIAKKALSKYLRWCGVLLIQFLIRDFEIYGRLVENFYCRAKGNILPVFKGTYD